MKILVIFIFSIAVTSGKKNLEGHDAFTVKNSFELGCDDKDWTMTKDNYDTCIATTYHRLQAYDNGFDPEVCGLMEKMIDCSELLSHCMESHLQEASAILFAMPVDIENWGEMMSRCEAHDRYKRSAGSTTSKVAKTVVKAAASRAITRTVQAGRTGKSAQQSFGRTSGAKTILGGFLGFSKVKETGKFPLARLGKVAKYAVGGLAAYGTYKLAKSMTKGLRQEYDEDDCWKYSILRDQYECVCVAKCNAYVFVKPEPDSAVSTQVTFSLLAVTTFLTTIHALRL